MNWIELMASDELQRLIASLVANTVHVRAERRKELLLLLIDNGSGGRGGEDEVGCAKREEAGSLALTPLAAQLLQWVASCVSPAIEAATVKAGVTSPTVAFWMAYDAGVRGVLEGKDAGGIAIDWSDFAPAGWEPRQLVVPIKAAVRHVAVDLLRARHLAPSPGQGGESREMGIPNELVDAEKEYVQRVSRCVLFPRRPFRALLALWSTLTRRKMYGWGVFLCLQHLQDGRPNQYLVLIKRSPWCRTEKEHWWHIVLEHMQLDKLSEVASIFPYNLAFDLGGLRFLSPALQVAAKLHYARVRAVCTVDMFALQGPKMLGMVQALGEPDALLEATFVAALEPRRASVGADPQQYAATVGQVLRFMLPAVVHSYLKEFAGDTQEADAARRGRQKDKACHREIVDFMKTPAYKKLLTPAPPP